MRFKVESSFLPAGDQPEAISKLAEGVEDGLRTQVLLGVTGSGKTFTIANLIEKCQRPALVIAHNKVLAAQLCNEFREFFPASRVEFFVSYYDYFQPEAYIAATDTYIEKDMSINDEIDKLRNSATSSLYERRDTIVVASVSCIYGLGAPEQYYKMSISLRPNQIMDRDELIYKLISINYKRSDVEFERTNFRVRGDCVEVFPSYFSERAIRIEFFGDEIERISEIEAVSGRILNDLKHISIFPATHFVASPDVTAKAHAQIADDLEEQIKYFEDIGKPIEAYRIKQRVNYDLEMMREIGYCTGIENYSRYFDGRKTGDPPYTLLDYFPKDFLVIIDESHMTLPQIRAMYKGDLSRKTALVDYGFRLPAAYDNRPLRFDEFNKKIGQVICVSATPAAYELGEAGQVVEQIIRPTGLVDPKIFVRPVKGQIDDLIFEIKKTVKAGMRVLITTLTKKSAESLTNYFAEQSVRARYLHSDIDTLERIEIINGLRNGDFDVLVGINLLREGLDLPEVQLVAILDADKEGFLRSESALIQTIGRAARNSEGYVIMYADTMTGSMQRAIGETERRRKLQTAFNLEHNIVPKTIKKSVNNSLIITTKAAESEMSLGEIPAQLEKLKVLMQIASKALDFERAIEIREEMARLKSLHAKLNKEKL